MAVTNKDIFEEFCRRIREEGATDAELMKDYGGMPIYVPSWSLNGRNNEILSDYIDNHLSPKELAMRYNLSLSRIYEILDPVRNPPLLLS
jgi:Mor family transcriptional regulator